MSALTPEDKRQTAETDAN